MKAKRPMRIESATEAGLRALTAGQTRPPVIIVGKSGSGKSRNAETLALHYRCPFILDGWTHYDPLANGCLVLTNDDTPGAIPIDKALRDAGLVEGGNRR